MKLNWCFLDTRSLDGLLDIRGILPRLIFSMIILHVGIITIDIVFDELNNLSPFQDQDVIKIFPVVCMLKYTAHLIL